MVYVFKPSAYYFLSALTVQFHDLHTIFFNGPSTCKFGFHKRATRKFIMTLSRHHVSFFPDFVRDPLHPIFFVPVFSITVPHYLVWLILSNGRLLQRIIGFIQRFFRYKYHPSSPFHNARCIIRHFNDVAARSW